MRSRGQEGDEPRSCACRSPLRREAQPFYHEPHALSTWPRPPSVCRADGRLFERDRLSSTMNQVKHAE